MYLTATPSFASLESLCDNKEIIENNIRSVKISSPDYRGWDPDKAVADYYNRIRDHERHYESVSDTTHWPFIKIVNVSAIYILILQLTP